MSQNGQIDQRQTATNSDKQRQTATKHSLWDALRWQEFQYVSEGKNQVMSIDLKSAAQPLLEKT